MHPSAPEVAIPDEGARAPAALARGVPGTGLLGILGRPFVDVAPLLGDAIMGALDEVHEEICLAFAQVPTGYTGGSHRSMGIMPEGLEATGHVDYGEVIAGLSDRDFATFRELSDDPEEIDIERRHETTWGEERDVPLSRRQMLWLEARFGVYFPWQAYVELIPNHRWEDKADAAGKAFNATARAFFPKTIALVKQLPFASIGRCNVYGVRPFQHGTVHRDGDAGEPDPFLTLCPRGDKRLFLWDPEARAKVPVAGRAYWFNDRDYHGVEPDPYFRYSIRVDGPFRPEFLDALRAQVEASS
jgi:hypothetical protein